MTLVTTQLENKQTMHNCINFEDITTSFFNLQDGVDDVPLNIAVTGNSGSGKSTLVNTMRGLYADDPGATPVGITETTHEPQEYKHPEHTNVALWDLPGVGTSIFPRSSYLDQIDVERYDFFLILSDGRSTENVIWLAEELEIRGKPYYFVRTKVNMDIQNDKEDNPRSHSAERVISKLKQECRNDMIKFNIRANIFAISGMKKHDTAWEYPALILSIMNHLPKLKQYKGILSGVAMSKEIIQEKCKVLDGRIFKVALASAAAAVIPLSGVSIATDIGLLVKEIVHYKKQLGVDSVPLSKWSREMDIPMTSIEGILSQAIPTFALVNVYKYVLQKLARNAAGADPGEVARFIPVVGTVVASGISFETTRRVLNGCLSEVKEGALMILEEKIKQSRMDAMNT